jgi:hypothetical protein
MHDWLGTGLIALGLGLAGAGVFKFRSRRRAVVQTGDIRPEFAAMGEMVRPMILFCVAVVAAKMSLFYFVLGGSRFMTPLDYAGLMFVLAAYIGYLVAATSKRRESAAVPAIEAVGDDALEAKSAA